MQTAHSPESPPMNPFLGLIEEDLARFEHRLDEALHADVELVHEIARYMATLKGKRLRPALALLGAKATGQWDERIIDAATSVEMIHAATMIHDDVIDSATLRRGKASVNTRWTGQTAVLMGDFLLSRALSILTDLGNIRALQIVARATERLSQGEIYEIQIGEENDTREESYFSMVSDKTASLIVAACQLGPILVEAPESAIEAMGQYGEALGTAFQIADDILDFTGDADTLGKPVGHDLREGKITLPLIRALQAAPRAARSAMEALLGRPDKGEADWSAIVAFVDEYGGVAAASDTARNLADRGQQCLEVFEISAARSALELAVKLAVERDN